MGKIKQFFIIIFLSIMLLPSFAEEPKILPSETGIIQEVNYVDTENSIVQTKQIARVKLLTGEFKNKECILENVLTGNPNYDIKLKKGTKVILHAEEIDNKVEYSIEDISRSSTLFWLAFLFCALLIYVGKIKGAFSLISIALTIMLIYYGLSPMILAGINPILSTIIICILSTFITMYLVGGFNAKSTSATLGVILSLISACALSAITMSVAHLTGFSGENTMFLYSAHPELDFVSIAISAMIIATLGAVMDVAMSIASTINEIYINDNSKTVSDLFKSGMNVGKDIIGTMANTLILVYLGGSLPLLLLAGNIDTHKFFNLNQVVTEIASAIIGSISIVICVPLTAITASLLISKYARYNKLDISKNCNCDL